MDANCTLTRCTDHARQAHTVSKHEEDSGSAEIPQRYSAAEEPGGTAGKATGQGRRTRIDLGRHVAGVAMAAAADVRRSPGRSVVCAVDERDRKVSWTIDWVAQGWRRRRRRCS